MSDAEPGTDDGDELGFVDERPETGAYQRQAVVGHDDDAADGPPPEDAGSEEAPAFAEAGGGGPEPADEAAESAPADDDAGQGDEGSSAGEDVVLTEGAEPDALAAEGEQAPLDDEEPAFVDARPATAAFSRSAVGDVAAAEAGDAAGDAAATGPTAVRSGGDDDLVFDTDREVEQGADEDGSLAVLAAQHAAARARADGEAEEVAPEPTPAAPHRRPSGRQRALEERTLRDRPTGGDWEARPRAAERVAEAVEAALAAAPPAPFDDPHVGARVCGVAIEGFLGLHGEERRYVGRSEGGEQLLVRALPLGGRDDAAADQRQAEQVFRVEDPRIEHLRAVERVGAWLLVVSEFPLGVPLSARVREGNPLPAAETFALLEQMGAALEALHGRGVVHGGVSVDTVQEEQPGVFVLTDGATHRQPLELGLLATSGPLSAPGYIAPEAIERGPERASDLYGLGCVALAAANGAPPVEPDDPWAAVAAQLEGKLAPLKAEAEGAAGAALATIVANLTAPQPDGRYANAAALVADARAAAAGQPVQRLAAAEGAKAAPVRRPGRAVAGDTVLLLLLVALDIALLLALAFTAMRGTQVPLGDPVDGYELPMPGASEGGFTGR